MAAPPRSTACLTPKGGSRSSFMPSSPSSYSHHKSKLSLPIIKFLMIGSIVFLALHYAVDYGGFNDAVVRRSSEMPPHSVEVDGSAAANAVANGGKGTGMVGDDYEGSAANAVGKDSGVSADRGDPLPPGNNANGNKKPEKKGALLVVGTLRLCPTGPAKDNSKTSSSSSSHGELARLFLKNKVDYAGYHGFDVWPFLGDLRVKEAPLSPDWTKIALINYLWQSHTEREWFLWMDGHVMVLDMAFQVPWSRYKGFDLVLWGKSPEVFVNLMGGGKGRCQGVNTEVLLVRRSKWARKLLKEMLSLQGQIAAAVDSAGAIMSDLRATLSDLPADGHFTPECAISYLVANNTEWRQKMYLETEYSLNAHWSDSSPALEDFIIQPTEEGRVGTTTTPTTSTGAGAAVDAYKSQKWVSNGVNPPFTVTFADCSGSSFCTDKDTNGDGGKNNANNAGGSHVEQGVEKQEECIKGIRKAFAFGNNQVIAALNLRYKSLYDNWVVPIAAEEEEKTMGEVDDGYKVDSNTPSRGKRVKGLVAKVNASASPLLRSAEGEESPKGEGEAPKGEGEAPKGEGEAPKGEGEASKGEGEAPKGEGETPLKVEEAPKRGEGQDVTKDLKEDAAPKHGGQVEVSTQVTAEQQNPQGADSNNTVISVEVDTTAATAVVAAASDPSIEVDKSVS